MPRTLTAADFAGIHQALAQFAHTFDNGETDALGEAFSQDVTVENTIGGGYSVPGLAAAASFTRGRRPDTPDHHTHDTVVLIAADDTVRARSRYIATLVDGTVHAGEYFDIVENTDTGWRITYRISAPRYPALPAIPLTAEFLEPWQPNADNVAVPVDV